MSEDPRVPRALSKTTAHSVALARIPLASRRHVLLKMLAAAATVAGSALARAHPIFSDLIDPSVITQDWEKVAAGEWKPQFFNPEQNRLLVALAERMLPGSTQVQVNRIIDLVLSIENASQQKNFLSSLSAINQETEEKFKKRFYDLPPNLQDEALTACSSGKSSYEFSESADPDDVADERVPVTLRDDFESLKGWVVAAYYATETGMRELGWTENFYFEELPGCQHASQHAAVNCSAPETTADRARRFAQEKS